ncbi:MAG TPA: DoxX family protein [Cyclobacteriaceae bacterium]|nr:DoxX family protein [Cyclobacteriaceae bacterium]
MQKIIDQFSRFFVGGLFIFSGLIKLNDPVGTAIKLEEYFEVFTQDFGAFFHYFIPWSLEMGLLLIVLELALGVAILIFYRMQQTTWVLLGLMIFFTFLTFYSAYFDKVTDCGCFGDAIKLTPWESFWKDIVLMVFVSHLFWYRKTYRAELRTMEGHSVMLITSIIFFFTGIYALRHLPFIDFRPYKIGNNIQQQMLPGETPVIEYVFEKDGKAVRSAKFLPAEEGYAYKSSEVLNADKIKPKITDYSVTGTDGEDLTAMSLSGIKLFIIMEDVRESSTKNMDRLRTLVQALDGKVEIMALTSSSSVQMESFRHENQLAVPYAFTDATVLKTMIRSNPGIILLRDGTVLGHWHYNDVPDSEEVISLLK